MDLPLNEADAISKVFLTSYSYRSDSNFRIVLYNIVLPANIVHDVNQRQIHLEQANQRIIEDFGGIQEIYYQITGCYTLVNRDTNVTQLWTGSFYTNYLRNPSQIQGFRKFNPQTFVNSSFQLLNSAEQILLANGKDSKWKFESLNSIIFNFQVKINKNNEFFQRRDLQSGRRVQKSFNLF